MSQTKSSDVICLEMNSSLKMR